MADRYILDREVGRGACGAVWAAEDEVLRRPVAIKRVGPIAGDDAGDDARAEREARLAAQVNHPHVISVFDLVHDGGHHWLVMEYVDGDPLSSLIRDHGALSPEQAADLLGPVADALAAAHELGIVHRDVKPSNILVHRDGDAKLSDFGIARATQDATLTQTGVVTGSPAYLAPEVAAGAFATPASDVWSFGATLFHALAGRPPYHRDGLDNSAMSVLYRVVHEDPPRLPAAGWVAPLIERTMTRDPARRPTMAEVRDWLDARGVGYEPPRSHLRPLLLAAASVAALAVLGIVLALLNRADGPPAVDAATADVAPSVQAATTPAAQQPTGPTAADLEEFAESYVRTADRDPGAGFRMLTPAYQRRSPEYEGFWGPMSNPRILEVGADVEQMTVTYTYAYDFPGSGKRTEQVTLELVERDGRLLIDGAR